MQLNRQAFYAYNLQMKTAKEKLRTKEGTV